MFYRIVLALNRIMANGSENVCMAISLNIPPTSSLLCTFEEAKIQPPTPPSSSSKRIDSKVRGRRRETGV